MTTNQHRQLTERLNRLAVELKAIRDLVDKRRQQAGKQLDSDHDNGSCRWLAKDVKQLMAPLLRNGTWKP